MWQAMDDLSIPAFQADALFASAVQRCDEPDSDQVWQAIAAAIRAFGSIGCAERVAQEFGDHPETAVVRMRWARFVIGEACPDWAPPQLRAADTSGSRGLGALSEQELWRAGKVSALKRKLVATHIPGGVGLGPDLARRSTTMNPSISEVGLVAAFADDAPVLVRYPRTPEQLWGDRDEWPWLPGTIMEQCGPDEWRVVVEDVTVAVRKDGSKPAPRTPKSRLYYPCCLRDSSELMLRGVS